MEIHAGTLRAKLKEEQKSSDYLFVLPLIVVVFCATFYLFVQQMHGLCLSDMVAHVHSAITGRGYSLNSLFLKISYKVAAEYGCALYLSIVTVCTMTAAGILFKQLLRIHKVQTQMSFSRAVLIAGMACFMGGIYVPNVYPVFYLERAFTGPGSANSICMQPWHNATYLLMRLFGTISILLFVKLRNKYKTNDISISEWLQFSLILILTNAAKPNFAIAFGPAMLSVLIYDFVKTKGKAVLKIIKFGSCFLVSIPILFAQKESLFPQEEQSVERGIIFTTELFKKMLNSGRLLPVLVTGLFYFSIVTIECVIRHELKWTIVFGWILLLIALLESIFISEVGVRELAWNFGWGLPFAAYIMAVFCAERVTAIWRKIHSFEFFYVITPYVLMMITGLVYFAHLLEGGSFLC